MKASELRIGNTVWVEWKVGFICTIDSDSEGNYRGVILNKETDLFHRVVVEEDMELVRLIPLTSEILEKIGFVHTRENWYHLKICNGCRIVSVSIVDKSFCISDDDFDNETLWLFEPYLHKLQNVIHALTGEELNVEIIKWT